MSRNILKNVPIGVLFIASFYVFGAFIILAWVFIDPTAISGTIAKAHGFLPVTGIELSLVVAVLALILVYGLVRLSRWGFILTMAYSMYICLVNLISGSQTFTVSVSPENSLYYGNFIFSLLVIVYLLVVRRNFFSAQVINQRVLSDPK